MGINDLQLLEARLDTYRADSAPDMDEGAFFNLYVTDLVLRRFQPGMPAVRSGIVDGKGDCGIDAFYCFINNQMLIPGLDFTRLGKRPSVTVIVVQTKRAQRFEESPLDKLELHLPRLLNLDRDEMELQASVNPGLRHATKTFIDACRQMAHLGAEIKFEIHYATRGEQIHENTRARAADLQRTLTSIIPSSSANVFFHGPKALLDLARKQDQINKELSITAGPIASESSRGEGYVCLVSLSEILKFVTDSDSEELQPALFEANVRDHYEESSVNRGIHDTLRDSTSPDFWWLNNGITIIAPYVQQMGKKLYLTDPQIVNGLQTANEIYLALRGGQRENDGLVLVRVIRAIDEEVRDAIIRATNNQNELPAGALRATDRLQHNIEEYFKKRGFYYDRRKNHYRKLDKIISMDFLAQSLTSTLLQEPWRARREPGALLDDEVYPRIFSDDIPLESYLSSLLLTRRVGQALTTSELSSSVDYAEDYLHHVSMIAAILLTRKEAPSARDIANMDVMGRLSNDHSVQSLVPLVGHHYQRYLGRIHLRPESDAASDQATSEAILDSSRRLLRSVWSANWPRQPLPEGYHMQRTIYMGERRSKRL